MSKNVMQGVLGLLAVGCVLALVGPAAAEFTPENSDNFDWKYEMRVEDSLLGWIDAKPSETDLDDNGTMDFTEVSSGGGTGSVADGILTMSTGADPGLNYDNAAADQTWQLDPDITYANGYTFEVCLQIVGDTRPDGFRFVANLGSADSGAGLNVMHNGQKWGNGTGLGSDANNDDYHVFRVAQAPGATTFSVWRDGELLSDSLGNGWSSGANAISFGDNGWDLGGAVEIDYFRFTAGAWAPDDTPPPPIPGDANLDNIVNDADASILAAHWQQSGAGIGWGDGDFDGNNVVNDADASILAAHWQESQEGSTAPVPEPSVLVLLFSAGLIGLLARARRRR